MRKILVVAVLFVLSSPLLGQAHDEGTSNEFSYFTYREQAGNVTFMVDSYTAFYAAGQPYVPLHVAIAVFKGTKLDLSLESFSLLDAEGNRAYPASFGEIENDYKRLQQDKELMRMHPMNVGQQMSTLSQASSTFYPETASRRMATESVELPVGTWWQDTIYFPMPSGLDGVMSMELRASGLEDPITVKFRVPQKGHDKEKEKKKG